MIQLNIKIYDDGKIKYDLDELGTKNLKQYGQLLAATRLIMDEVMMGAQIKASMDGCYGTHYASEIMDGYAEGSKFLLARYNSVFKQIQEQEELQKQKLKDEGGKVCSTPLGTDKNGSKETDTNVN